MSRVVLPPVDPALLRHVSLRHLQPRKNGSAAARQLPVLSRAEVRNCARLLVDQYGDEAEALAEIGVIEMLAMKDGVHLIAWSMIFTAIRELRAKAANVA